MRDLVVVLGLAGLLPMALAQPWIGLLGYTLIGFWNPHKFTWYLKDLRIAFVVGLATLIGLAVTRDRKGVAWSRELVLMIMLAVYFVITSFFAWVPEAARAQGSVVYRIYFMTFVMGMLIFGEKKIRGMLWVIMIGIGLFGVKGGIFSLLTGGQYHVVGPETTFLEANTSLGLAFNMTLPLLVYAAQEQTIKWRKYGLYAAAILTVIATIFTYSRGAWIGLAATGPLVLLRMKRGWLIAVAMAPIALGALALIPSAVKDRAGTIGTYQQDNSAMTRIQAWSVAWNVAVSNPLTGGGFDYENYPDPSRWLSYADRKYDVHGQTPRAAHSIYFQVLGQHGFLCFFLFVGLLASTMVSLTSICRNARGRPGLEWIEGYAKALQTGMVGFLVSGAFLNLAYFDLVYLYIGLVPILRRELREHGALAPAVTPQHVSYVTRTL
jgi:probable O-glycosylation ligase (exosortase A-associated)